MAPSCHPSLLSTCSAALYLLITIGVVTYWRGVWVLMDQLLGYDDNAALSGWYSLAIGFGGAVALYVCQAMRATCFASVASTTTTTATTVTTAASTRTTPRPCCAGAAAVVGRRVGTLGMSVVCINAWRGVWVLNDAYVLPVTRTLSGLASTLAGAALLVALLHFQSVLACPCVILADDDTGSRGDGKDGGNSGGGGSEGEGGGEGVGGGGSISWLGMVVPPWYMRPGRRKDGGEGGGEDRKGDRGRNRGSGRGVDGGADGGGDSDGDREGGGMLVVGGNTEKSQGYGGVSGSVSECSTVQHVTVTPAAAPRSRESLPVKGEVGEQEPGGREESDGMDDLTPVGLELVSTTRVAVTGPTTLPNTVHGEGSEASV